MHSVAGKGGLGGARKENKTVLERGISGLSKELSFIYEGLKSKKL